MYFLRSCIPVNVWVWLNVYAYTRILVNKGIFIMRYVLNIVNMKVMYIATMKPYSTHHVQFSRKNINNSIAIDN